MGPEILIFLVVMLGLMWFVTSRGRKQQAAARERLNEALVPGTWVMTIGGFFGKVVDVDGDVITLESPAGQETIWFKNAIKEAKEPPYAVVEEDEDSEEETQQPEVAQEPGPADVTTTPEQPSTTTEDPTMRPGGPTVGDDGRLGDDKR
ncbi:preprotein translocase subunit YajC [Georgenia alba]|uniref:Preprotein translocase subunit YajC n=1 Tax=Georgenia alba TaxID=2233858 RepID=A0ABW2Q9F4_9MICO